MFLLNYLFIIFCNTYVVIFFATVKRLSYSKLIFKFEIIIYNIILYIKFLPEILFIFEGWKIFYMKNLVFFSKFFLIWVQLEQIGKSKIYNPHIPSLPHILLYNLINLLPQKGVY